MKKISVTQFEYVIRLILDCHYFNYIQVLYRHHIYIISALVINKFARVDAQETLHEFKIRSLLYIEYYMIEYYN